MHFLNFSPFVCNIDDWSLNGELKLFHRFSMGFVVFTVTNLVLTLFASVLTAFVAPAAAGSGIPEVKAYLNGVDAPEIFSLRTLVVKVRIFELGNCASLCQKFVFDRSFLGVQIIGNISAVSASLLIGKAGPMVHTGACVASILGQGGSKRYGLTWRWLRFFKNDRDRRDLVTCGSAAGIAASFRAPVGGVLFALEEMSSWYVKLCQVILLNSMCFLY